MSVDGKGYVRTQVHVSQSTISVFRYRHLLDSLCQNHFHPSEQELGGKKSSRSSRKARSSSILSFPPTVDSRHWENKESSHFPRTHNPCIFELLRNVILYAQVTFFDTNYSISCSYSIPTFWLAPVRALRGQSYCLAQNKDGQYDVFLACPNCFPQGVHKIPTIMMTNKYLE